MNYQELKARCDSDCKKLADAFATGQRQLAKTEKRLNEDIAIVERIRIEKEKLSHLSLESVDDLSKYKSFKASIRRLNSESEAAAEAVEVLRNKVIPNLKAEIKQSELALQMALRAVVVATKPAVEEEMNDLMDQIISLRDNFLDSFSRVHRDFGLTFVVNDLSLIPKPVHDRLKKLEIQGRSALQRAELSADPAPPKAKVAEAVEKQVTVMTG